MDRSDLAESDLVEIWFHIAFDDPTAADRFIDQIDTKVQRLAKSPGIGVARDKLSHGYRDIDVRVE